MPAGSRVGQCFLFTPDLLSSRANDNFITLVWPFRAGSNTFSVPKMADLGIEKVFKGRFNTFSVPKNTFLGIRKVLGFWSTVGALFDCLLSWQNITGKCPIPMKNGNCKKRRPT